MDKLDFTLLVLPGAYAASVAASQDILETAATLAPRLQLRTVRWQVVSPVGGRVALSGGMGIDTEPLIGGSSGEGSTWVVPGLGLSEPAEIALRLEQACCRRAAAALRDHAERGGSVAASCSAVFLLQAAGLLRGRRTTTSWWLASELRRIAPDSLIDADRMVVIDGPIASAGAAFGHTDLMLTLVRRRLGPELADMIARVLLLDGRQAQSPYVMPTLLSQGHALIERVMQRIETALPNPPSIAALAREFGVSQRTLARQVRSATGRPPLALVQAVRLNRARVLIESSRKSVEQVAAEVGYSDATALRRMMRKAAGANPSAFRSDRSWS